MFDSLSAVGFLVHTPCGPRKSGIPDSVEMPAPVSATTRDDPSTMRHAVSIASPIVSGSPVVENLPAQAKTLAADRRGRGCDQQSLRAPPPAAKRTPGRDAPRRSHA